MVNAQTLIAGKIYGADYSSTITDASVRVTCGSESLNTISLGDGTYAVRFEQADCDLGYSVSVVSDKGGLTGSGSGVIIECDNANCDENYFAIINLALKARQTSHSSGSGGKIFICGNGKCDSGETVNTCPRDCKVIIQSSLDTTGETNSQGETDPQTGTQTEEIKNPVKNSGFLENITGAAVGAWNNSIVKAALIIVLIGLIILLIVFIALRKRGMSY
jgi:hypothetical protein